MYHTELAGRYFFSGRDHLAVLVEHLDLLQQIHHRIGRLRADADPVASAITLDFQHFGLAGWAVMTDDLDKFAIAWSALVRHHHTIAGLLGFAGAPEPNPHHNLCLPPITGFTAADC